MNERIDLAELRHQGIFHIATDELEALVEAVEADHALEVVEAKGLSLDPAEHREAIARHDNALAKFDFGDES